MAELMYQIELAVVPHAGTWIEIFIVDHIASHFSVVPHVGTWIEIGQTSGSGAGLAVVPHAGTWIEILACAAPGEEYYCRSPRGNVD